MHLLYNTLNHTGHLVISTLRSVGEEERWLARRINCFHRGARRVGEASHYRVALPIDRPAGTRDPVFKDTTEELG